MGVTVREKLKGSGEWWIFINHKGKRKAKKIGKDKKMALEAARKIEAKLALQEFGFIKDEKKPPLFRDYSTLWVNTYVKTLRRPNTYSRYYDLLKKHVVPVLGNKSIDEITRGEVRDLILHLRGLGYSKTMCQLVFTVINGPLAYAVEEGLIKENPIAGLTRRLEMKIERQVIEPMTAEEVDLVLNSCREHFTAYYPFFLCAFRTGMRLGELLGLSWDDIDWNGRYINVRRSYKKKVVGPTKTGRSRRVDMSKQLCEVLLNLMRTRKVVRMTGQETAPDFVFQKDGQPMEQGFIRRVFKAILKKAGLRERRVHEARHAYASLLLSQGVSPVYVKEQLGHSGIQITVDIYGHLIPGSNREAVNLLDTHQNATPAQPAKIEKAQPIGIAPSSVYMEPMWGFEPQTC